MLWSLNKILILWIPVHIRLGVNKAEVSKGAGTLLYGPKPFDAIGKGFMAKTMKNEDG